MSRLKQNQSIDSVINCINTIVKSQCSHSETDLILLNEALERLENLKRKKGKTNGQIRQEITHVIGSLLIFFMKN